MKQFDLRSDTITKPTQGMREAMYRAEVGDDVYREDPTVNRLEAMAAQLTGKERALFVTSGSMGNLIALYINCGRGNEVLAAQDAHIHPARNRSSCGDRRRVSHRHSRSSWNPVRPVAGR
jgi:threonine aldolase